MTVSFSSMSLVILMIGLISHKLLLTSTQVSWIRKAFADGSSANIKLLKTHLFKIIQLR